MKATELRIGNYVMYEQTTHIIRTLLNRICTSLWINDTVGDVYTHTFKDITPIPITEEWLLKFGFEKLANDGRYGYRYYIAIADYWYVIERDWRKEQSHFFGIEYTDCPNPKDDHIYHSFTFKLKHIHQLQNLYFALTGKELTI